MALARRYIERGPETRSYYNPANGNFYSEVSRLKHTADFGIIGKLEEVFSLVDTNNFYICPMPKGTYNDPDSVYPKKKDLEAVPGIQLVRYYSRTGSATIKVGERQFDFYPLGTWFNFPDGGNLSDAVKAMGELKKLLSTHFQPTDVAKSRRDPVPVELLPTPALTGMDLLRRKLPFNVKYEALPSDIEHIILTNFSQARQQLLNHGQDTIEELYNYDGLWMYAACTRHVPIGRILHDDKDEYVPYTAGFYKVRTHVPLGWNHIGLLPMKNPSPVPGARSLYPDVPEFEFESWCSDRELRLAEKSGWSFKVLERILWPDTNARGIPGQDPLRYWTETLVSLRQEEIAKYPEPMRGMLKDAIRNLLNMGIGKMSAGSHKVDVYTADFDEYPGDNAHLQEEYADGSYRYSKEEALTDFQKQGFMPHWVRYVWCHCKEMITREALKIPYNQLVSIRTDGLWTTAPSSQFKDTGKPGCMREKQLTNRGPFSWPKDDIEFVRMIQVARGGKE